MSAAAKKIRRKPGRPSKAKAPPPRAELLQKALECFAQDGYDKVSLRRLAAELGINDALLIHYFGSKEALWDEAVALAGGNMAQVLEGALGSAAEDPLQRLIDSVELTLRLGAGRPQILRLAFQEEASGSERAARLRAQFMEPYLAHVDQVLRECQRRKRMGDIAFNALHAMIVGAVRLLVEPHLLGARALELASSEVAREAYIQSVLALLRHGLAGKP